MIDSDLKIISQQCSPLHEKCPHSEFFWSVFSRIRSVYGELKSKVLIRENMDQKNSEYGQFLYSLPCVSVFQYCVPNVQAKLQNLVDSNEFSQVTLYIIAALARR